MSRGRYDDISTTKLLPEWVEILVPESEKEKYEYNLRNPIITTPDNVQGLGMLRNWCLDNFDEEIVIMIDDDINKFYCLTGEYSRSVEQEEFVQVLINTALMAKDLGVKCFGYAQSDIRKYNGCDPFSMATWFGTIFGVIGRRYRFREDKFKVDIDYVLQNLLVDRIVWVDNRYYANNNKDNNKGGNSIFRTKESFEMSVKTLADKWGECLKISDYKNQKKIKLNISRKQSIKI